MYFLSFVKALNQYRDNLTVLKKIAESADYKKFKMWGGSIEKTYSYHEGDFVKAIRSFEAIDTITIRSYERAGFFHDDFYKILYKSI